MNALLDSKRPHLQVALQTAQWIDRARVVTKHGCTWLECPEDPPPEPAPFPNSLHCGAIGVVLFWLELYGATRDEAHLKRVLDGVDHLKAVLPLENCSDEELGMYFGLSGAVYMLELAYRVAGRPEDHTAAQKCVAELRRHAQVAKAKGLTWSRGQDICDGRGGAGLIALWWSRLANDDSMVELAVQAGRTVVRRAKPHPKGGIYWEGGPSELVGFAHGCSGAAYFLAVLYEHTREKVFLDTAIAAAYRLQQIAIELESGGCLIPSIMRNGDQVVAARYVQWCNGAVGIWRLFFQLARVTNEWQWTDWVHRIALGAMRSGIPENRKGLLPESAILCCGDAGVAQGFLDLYTAYGDDEYLNFARTMHAAVMNRATVDETGMRWYAAEPNAGNRGRARTGFMSGAAGIGTWSLRLDAFEQHRQPIVKLPDSPF